MALIARTSGTSGRRRRPGRARSVFTGALFAAVAVAGCGISPDAAPRDIDLASSDEVGRTNGGQAATGEGQVFLVAQDGSGVPSRLIAVTRDVDAAARRGDPTSVLDALLAGPNAAERDDEITTLLPADLEVLTVSNRPGGVVVVDLSEPFGDLTGQTLVLALAQLVHTVSEVGGVNGVRVTVEGENRPWPDVNGRQQNDALTVFDFPGLVRTSQPPFPAVPSD